MPPHGRDRVWFVATNTKFKSTGSDGGTNDETEGNVRRGNEGDVFGTLRGNGITSDTDRISDWGETKQSSAAHKQGWSGETNSRIGNEGEQQFIRDIASEGNATDTKDIGRKDALENGELEGGRFRFGNKPPAWDSFPSQSPICGGDDGLPTELDNITFSKWRNESIKAYGNAIVPQVAYEIFKAIERTI